MNLKKFETIRQAQQLASKKIRKGTFQWLEAGAEDNYTTDLNINFLNSVKFIPKVLSKNNDLKIKKKVFVKLYF